MMSTSWMLCSSSAPAPARATSPRQVDLYMPCSGMYWSSWSMTLMTRPLVGSVINLRIQQKAGEKRSTSPTWFTTPASRTTSAIRTAPARSVARGFSQKMARPRAAAISTRRGCSDVQVQMNTASQPSRTSSSSAHTVAPVLAANVSARERSVS